MILDCDFIALNNADDILPYGTYKSGIMDGDKSIYKYGYPSSKHPVLNLAFILKDFEGTELAPGHYEVVLSPSRKMMYLVESNKIRASVPVAKLVEKMVNDQEELEKLKKKQKLEKKYKNRPRKRPKDTSSIEEQAQMNATISDSHQGFYILRYKNGNIQATGYILK